ncbi:hypothetical protein AB4068_15460 [Arthrobacter sp. 2RAF22]|uniref:hypothetical protein n=1 Tax=Arthrobacter sp. 2RAF22 TaxID=3232996 RepID=UPI003F8FE4E9
MFAPDFGAMPKTVIAGLMFGLLSIVPPSAVVFLMLALAGGGLASIPQGVSPWGYMVIGLLGLSVLAVVVLLAWALMMASARRPIGRVCLAAVAAAGVVGTLVLYGFRVRLPDDWYLLNAGAAVLGVCALLLWTPSATRFLHGTPWRAPATVTKTRINTVSVLNDDEPGLDHEAA